MLSASKEILDAWMDSARQLSIRVKVDTETYGSEEITSLSFDSGSISGEVYQIGTTYMNSVQISFPSIIETIKEDQEVIPELGIFVGGEYHYTKLGHFFITEFERNRNSKVTTIKASDKMIYLEAPYESKLSYPKEYREVALEIANLAGVEINPTSFASLGVAKINKPEGYTYRQAVSLIAQFEGGFANFNRDGKLEIRRLQPTDFEIKPESYLLKGFTKNENAYRIGGITVKTGENEGDVLKVGSTNGSQIELENKVMTQAMLDTIWAKVKDINYFPFELKWRGCPILEAGDWIYITDKEENRYSVPNLSYTLTFNGGLSASSKATTNSSSQATYKYRGSLKQKVDYIDSLLNSNGWNSNYYDQTEPQNPKKGDLWFKPNGQDIELYQWDGTAWELIITTAKFSELDEAMEEVNQAVEEAKADTQTAITSANEAVEKANQAAEAADNSTELANQAKQDALNAVANASTAKQDAQAALQNAQDAQEGLTTEVKRIDGQLATKVSETTFDKLANTVTTQGTQIEQNKSDIALKASGLTVNMLTNTVTSHETLIKQNADAIKLKANKTEVDTVKDTVSSVESSLEVQAGQIKALNTKTDGHTTQIGSLQSSYDGLSSTVAELEDDVVDKFSSVNQTVNSIQTTVSNKADKAQVTQLSDQITSTVQTVKGHTSQINQLADNINMRVEKDDVINQINISDESILISGSKIHITGYTTIDNAVISTAMIKDAAITNAKIGDLSASKITTGTLNAANVNIINMNANNITSGYLNADRIAANSITAGKLTADAIQVGFNNYTTGIVLNHDTIRFANTSGENTFRLTRNFIEFYNFKTGSIAATVKSVPLNLYSGSNMYGLSIDLGSEANSFFSVQTTESGNSAIKLAYLKYTNQGGHSGRKGFNFYDELSFWSGAQTTKIGTTYLGSIQYINGFMTANAGIGLGLGGNDLWFWNGSRSISLTTILNKLL